MINPNIKDLPSFIEFVVIGFGASGIAASIELSKYKIPFIVLEKDATYGGCWNNAIDTSCLQTHRSCYKFYDVEYDKGVGNFPNKKEILSYFKKSIGVFDIQKRVFYNVNASIKKGNEIGNWIINIADYKVIYCNHILICSGVNFKPNIPKYEQLNFNILKKNKNQLRVIHSKDFSKFIKINENYLSKKRKIIIVGNGASCCDILKNISSLINYKNSELIVFYRSDKYYIPKYIFGIPCHYFLTKPLLYFFEKLPLKLTLVLLTLANMLFINNYLDTPLKKIDSYNIIASLIIQKLIKESILSYHKENIEKIDYINKIVKTDAAMYKDVDLVVFATGYRESDFKDDLGIDIQSSNVFYNYIIPVIKENNSNKSLKIIPNIGLIGFNRTYNFLLNSQVRTKWYIENVALKNNLVNDDIISWINKTEKRKTQNNLKFLDSTYELFEINYRYLNT
jgi:hypothetical protein